MWSLPARRVSTPAAKVYHIMSYIVTPFEVSSRALAEPVKVRFVHLFAAIATRHSDTIDCVFLVDGQHAMVSISCPALTELREKEQKYLSDQHLAEIAALHLRRTLEHGYDARQAELFVDGTQLCALGKELGYL
ncbi:MAG: hypothetical protein ABSA59_11740 [Terriglobia bacterium]